MAARPTAKAPASSLAKKPLAKALARSLAKPVARPAVKLATRPVVDLPAALAHLGRAPGPMRTLIEQHGPPTLRRTRNSFASLGRAIIYQQLHGKAASSIYRRFLGLYPTMRFPRPDELMATPMERLRSAGLSAAKASSLLDLAAKYRDGTVRTKRFAHLEEEALIEMLTQVRGIGPWSVHMFLIFGLLRPDVLPVGDLGVRRGMQIYFGLNALPAPAPMTELAEPWRPYRSVASWYMWRVAENGLPR
jgi:DNA-3-methyladenine glycosylase II